MSSEDIASIASKYGAATVGALFTEAFSELGVQITPEFLDKVETQGIQYAFQSDAAMLKEYANLSPEQQLAISKLADAQTKSKIEALAEATTEANINDRMAKLEDYKSKKEIDQLFKKKVSGGTDAGLTIEKGSVKAMMQNA